MSSKMRWLIGFAVAALVVAGGYALHLEAVAVDDLSQKAEAREAARFSVSCVDVDCHFIDASFDPHWASAWWRRGSVTREAVPSPYRGLRGGNPDSSAPSSATTTTVAPNVAMSTTTTTTTAAPNVATSTTTTTVAPTTTAAATPTTSTTTIVSQQVSGLGEGSVGLVVNAKSAFDTWTRSPNATQQEAMRDLYDRMVVYSPYFDSRLSWYPSGLAYINAFAIDTEVEKDDRSVTNPDWILRDESDNWLFVDYACSGGTCPQWAADVGNPEFRSDFLARIGALIDQGYPGIVLDDVNLEWRTSDGFGNRVIPVDPRTGELMTLQDWRRYFAEFVELIRTTYPGIEIMHNSLWFADSPSFDDPLVARQIAAADWIMLERGATDTGLVGGTGRTYSFESFLSYIDRAESLDTDVLLLDEGDYPGDLSVQEYNLAAYLLINSGRDLVSTEDYALIAYDGIWPGFTVDLGDAVGTRTRWEGLHRRDFTRGMVLLNEPDAVTITVSLPGEFTDIEGSRVTSVTLGPKSAAVLLTP